MFVHGEQADTILASLLALMASLPLFRCQSVTYPTCFVIVTKCRNPRRPYLSSSTSSVSQMRHNVSDASKPK